MSIEQVVNVVGIAIHKLPYMESLYKQVKDEVDKLQYTRQHLSNDIEARKHKISLLDKIAFACEQECSRKHQEIQELIAQKDRIEKSIANILNGEGYTKIKHIIKENVKAVLAGNNKKLISVSFAALIQTIKADPQMVNLILNIPSANDGEHKDNNIVKYLESNKDTILDLAEKNYQNLVEALTNNVIATASSSFNSTLPSSSPILLRLYNQNNTYRKEESESSHQSNGDIDN
jgi:hypothetical protein